MRRPLLPLVLALLAASTSPLAVAHRAPSLALRDGSLPLPILGAHHGYGDDVARRRAGLEARQSGPVLPTAVTTDDDGPSSTTAGRTTSTSSAFRSSVTTPTATPTVTPTTSSTSSLPSSSSASLTPTTSSAPSSSATSSSAPPSSSSVSSVSSATPTGPSSQSSSSSSALASSQVETTNSAGQVVTVIRTASASNASSSTSAPAAAASGGLSTGAIIGISVAGGVAVLALGIFIVFKSTRSRFADEGFVDDGIKWPELNQHGKEEDMGVALPARPTGGAGLRTNALDGEDSDDGHTSDRDHPSGRSESSMVDPYGYPPQQSSYYDSTAGYDPTAYDASGPPAGGGGAYYQSYDGYDERYTDNGGAYGGYDQHDPMQQETQGTTRLGRSPSGGGEMTQIPREGGGGGGGYTVRDDPFSVAGVGGGLARRPTNDLLR